MVLFMKTKLRIRSLSMLPMLAMLVLLSMCRNGETEVKGCTDPQAENHAESATLNDGSCSYASTTLQVAESVELDELLDESSGLIYWEGSVWTHNDSDDPFLYRLDPATGATLERIQLPGVENTDWESLAQDQEHVYVGNFGNNWGSRRDLRILSIQKSSLRSGAPRIDTLWFSYADQESFSDRPQMHDFDCEAMIARDGQLFLFTKQWLTAGTAVYVLDPGLENQVAQKVAEYPVEGLITGATHDPGTDLVILCGYTSGLEPFLYLLYDFEAPGFFSGNKRKIRVDLPFHQVEATALHPPRTLYLSNERVSGGLLPPSSQQLHRVELGDLVSSK